eukprot:8206490-Pyramimonas_sp.AAC.1
MLAATLRRVATQAGKVAISAVAPRAAVVESAFRPVSGRCREADVGPRDDHPAYLYIYIWDIERVDMNRLHFPMKAVFCVFVLFERTNPLIGRYWARLRRARVTSGHPSFFSSTCEAEPCNSG